MKEKIKEIFYVWKPLAIKLIGSIETHEPSGTVGVLRKQRKICDSCFLNAKEYDYEFNLKMTCLTFWIVIFFVLWVVLGTLKLW